MKKEINLFLTISVMCMGIFLCMLDTTIMNITLPAIQDSLGVTLNQLSWALNIYTITFAVMTIPLGRLAEIYGKNKIYILGFIIFCVGSLICSFSNDVSVLIFGRGVQSIGAAIIFPISMVIGISTVSIEKRSKVIAILGVTQGLSAALGPSIGGLITQFLGWRWVFLINVPLSIIAIVISFFCLNIKNEEKIKSKNDYKGAFWCVCFLFSLTLGLTQGNSWGWGSIRIIATFSVSILSFIIFIFTEKRSQYAMINLKLFKDRQFNASAVTVVFSNLFLIGVTVLLPTFLNRIHGESELRAALLVTPISAMIFVFSPIAGLLVDKVGRKAVIFTGFMAMAVAYYMLYHLDVSNGYTQLIIACLVLGFGYGIIVGPITVLAASSFTGELLTASQSVVGVLRQVGIVLAVAIFVSALTSNIANAKVQILDHAQKEILKLDITKEQQKIVLENTNRNLESEKINTNASSNDEKKIMSPEERSALIEAEVQKAIQQLGTMKPLNDATKKGIQEQVTVAVDQKITKVQNEVNAYAADIQQYSQNKISKSFSSLYGIAFFVIILCSLISFLYKEAEKKDRNEVIKVDS
ncbi:MFS transporter [Paenibacillus sp. GCM10012306]|uniref:MFS transporter n=1 Tax=Paenibacillus sp. GCM10012306 TaxID=3317342 RepID=UPI0036107A88